MDAVQDDASNCQTCEPDVAIVWIRATSLADQVRLAGLAIFSFCTIFGQISMYWFLAFVLLRKLFFSVYLVCEKRPHSERICHINFVRLTW